MNKSLKKMKFYDMNFKVAGILLLIAIIGIFFLGSIGENIGFIAIYFMIIPLIIIQWGMIYHQFKSKSYGWFFLTIVLFLTSLAIIPLLIFYWIKMRKEFKKGKGVYN